MSSIGQIRISDGAELLYLAYIVNSLRMYECRVYSDLSVSIQSVDFFDGNYNDLYNKPTLAAVATSGSYNDLADKPTIPAAVAVTDNLTSTSATDALSANQGRELKKMLDEYCPIIEDTRSSAVAEITGVAPFASLTDGQRILLKLKYNAGNNTNTTLNLTLSDGTSTTGAIDVYGGASTMSTLTKQISVKAGMYIPLIYDQTNSRWVYLSQKDNNTTYTTISQAEIDAGTNTNQRVVTPQLLVDNFEKRRTYVDNSADASVELSVATYNDLGTLSAWKPVTLPAYNRGDEFVFRFECGDADLSPVLPAGVVLADGFDFSEMAVGVTYQVSIMDGVAAYLCITPNI